jgi:four helix bundle protein
MDHNKPFDLRERFLALSKRTIRICKAMPSSPEALRIRDQLSGAVTSAGANYKEADGAYTKKDLINKLALARKEACEAKFFYRILDGEYFPESDLEGDIRELDEIVKILSKRIQKANSRKDQ